MLASFSVENFKGFSDRITLKLDSSRGYNFNQNIIRSNCISKGIVYGNNGSGKSNLGFAIFDIVIHLTDKQRDYTRYDNYLNLENEKTFAEFEYTFRFDGMDVVYRYSKSNAEKLLEEHLYIEGNEVICYNFDKHEGFSHLKGTEALNSTINRNGTISIVKYIYNNSILDDNAENRAFLKFMDFVDRMLFLYSTDGSGYQGFTNGEQNVEEGIIKRDQLKEFQHFLFENGIKYDLYEQSADGQQRIYCHFPRYNVGFSEIASVGTKTMEAFYYCFIHMQEASFVYIDDFDSFYHYDLAVEIVRELCSLKNVQIIMTTHNTNLMSCDLLRPDCYFIMNGSKIQTAADSTTKELKQAHSLQKMYKAGAFDNEKSS